MNRLTKKIEGQEKYLWDSSLIYSYKGTTLIPVINKLGKLEDLEEELGCPLEVLIKALRIGICIKDEQYLRFPDFGFFYDKFALFSIGANNSILAHRNTFYTKDYQKTWWLKGEKDENN